MNTPNPDQPAPDAPPPLANPVMVPWEYVTQTLNVAGWFQSGTVNAHAISDALNWYGSQGWELVSALGTAGNTGGTVTLVLIFKRQKVSQ